MARKSDAAAQVLRALEKRYGGPADLDEPRPLEQLILLILAQDADVKRARAAMRRLQAESVDWNEVRVSSVYEIEQLLSPLGARKAAGKGAVIKELLNTVYSRFNKLDLDFLQGVGSDVEDSKKRDRFNAFLLERNPALWAMMQLHGPKRTDVAVSTVLARALQRLGWLNGKAQSPKAIRDAFLAAVPEAQATRAQWGLYRLLEDVCLARNPLCPSCAVMKHCPSAQKGESAGDDAPKAPPQRAPRRAGAAAGRARAKAVKRK